MRDRFYLLSYKFFSFLNRSLPDSWMDRFILFFARFAVVASPSRRRVIYANLTHCFPDISPQEQKDIAIHSYQNLLYNIQSFLVPDKNRLLENIRHDGDQAVQKLLDEGKKVIFFTAHFGVWELLPYAIINHFKVNFAVVGRELNSPLMQRYLKEARERAGVTLIDKKGAMWGMIKALNEDKTLGLLIDQNLSKKSGGVDVDFCGHTATQTQAVSILAHKYDLILVPIFIHSNDFKQHQITCLPPISVDKKLPKKEAIAALDQAQADAVTEMIRRYPNEWFWTHKRFKYYDKQIYT